MDVNSEDFDQLTSTGFELVLIDTATAETVDTDSTQQASQDDYELGSSKSMCTCTRTSTLQRFKAGVLYIFTSLIIGFLFVVVQLVATTSTFSFWWWMTADISEIVFILAILSAVAHFIISVGGGAKYSRVFIGCIISVWMVVIVLMSTSPGTYRQTTNKTTTTNVDLKGCVSIAKLDDDFRLVDACFLNPLPSHDFVQYQYSLNTTKEALSRGLSLLRDVRHLLKGNMFEWKLGILEPILEKKCWGNMLDIVCNDALRKCRTIDCKIPSSACFAKNQLKLVQKAIKCANDNCDLCAPVQQEPASCRGPDKECSNNTISTTIEGIQLFNTNINNFLKQRVGDQQTADLVQLIFDRILYNFKQANDLEINGEKESKELEECTSWTIDLNNTQIDNQQVYCSNVPQIDITNKKNSGLMFTCILLYYTCVVMVLAKDYEKFRCSFKLNCSVRFGCLIIGIMMSLLMYIGSFHLRNGNATVWQVLYLLVSYTCMHGALLVIVPSNAKINVTERINEVDKSICFKNDSMFLGFKEQFWDASGEFFWLKLVLMEIFEMTLQVQSLATSAATSQVNDVALSAGIVAANFVVLPLVIILTPKIFESHHAVIAAIMIVEVFFDKLYVGVGVILRSDTLIQPNQSFMEQLTVHAALLLPAIMTALDVQDMLTLSFHTESVKSKMMHKSHKSHKIQKQNSIIVRAANGVDKVVHNSVFVAMERIFLISSILLGLILGLYMAISVTNIHIECLNNIGNIAGCANNKYYFANGLFSSTTCAFDQVTEFNCDQDYALSKILPDAEDKWSKMTNLELINVSNNKLEKAPTGWSTTPRSVTIDLRNSALSDLPFVLCAKKTNLTAIYFEGTAAGKILNWTGQLLLPTFNTQVINHACLSQLITLKNFNTLLLSHNSLTEEILEDNDLFVKFQKLTHLDMQYNNFAKLISNPMDTVFRPIIQRFVNAKDKNEEASNKSVSINLAGNPIKEVTIKGEQKLFVGEWVSILNTFTELKDHLKCIGCNIKGVSIIDALVKTKAFQEVLVMDFEKNEINGVEMMTALATGLRTAKVWNLNIVANGLEDIGANILIEVLPQTQIRELNIEGNPNIKNVFSMFHKNNITNVNGYKIKFKSDYNKE